MFVELKAAFRTDSESHSSRRRHAGLASAVIAVAAVVAVAGLAFPWGLAQEDAMMSEGDSMMMEGDSMMMKGDSMMSYGDTMMAPHVQLRFDPDSLDSRVQVAVIDAWLLYEAEGTDAFGIITPDVAIRADVIYQFVLDRTTLEMVANGAYPDFAGVIPDSLTSTDRPLERILADLDRDRATWTEYMATNPDTGTVQLKRAWLYLHDGYIFGAGHYLPESRVKYVVEDAVQKFEQKGTDAFDEITPKEDINNAELYPFVLNATDLSTVAHGTIPSFVGKCCSDEIRTTGDRPIEIILEDLRRDGGTWVEYVFPNPDTRTEQLKRTWLYLYDEYIFGSGYYLTDSRVQSKVEEAVHLYTSNGEDAFEIITPEAADELATEYAFVLDSTTLETVAHGAFPLRVGIEYDSLMEADKSLEQILAELRENEGAWVAYMSENPDTRTEQLTRAYLSLYDGYIFGSGYYFPDSRVQSLVDEALYTYRADSETAFDVINSGDLNRPGIYPVVRNTTHILAHGTFPGPWPLPDVQLARSYEESWAAAENGGGVAWSQYSFISKFTNTDQIKRAWLNLYDGYLFISTYSVADADTQSVVDHALFIYEANKENDAWMDIITPAETIITDEVYAFVLNGTDDPNIEDDFLSTVAHGTNPDLVGTCCSYAIQDTSTVPFDKILKELDETGRAWVTYIFLNPDTGTDQYKRTYLEVRDEYIFGAGYYILDSQAQSVAYNGVLEYNHDGRDAALAFFSIPPEVPTSTYLFIVDPDSGTVEAQNVDPNLIGTTSDWDAISKIEDISIDDLLDELSVERGTWVDYEFMNPETGEPEIKRTWLTMHDGLIFGSGYYASDALPQS